MKDALHALLLSLLLGASLPLGAADAPADPATADGGAPADARTLPADPHAARLEELKAASLTGEQLTLGAGDGALALYLPAQETPRGGMVLLHDLGSHLDTPGVIHPLRTRLPEHGWATLSLSLPPLEGDGATPAWLDATLPLIDAAIDTLQQRGNTPVVLAGHGLGALAAVDYLAGGRGPSVQGLILIGMDGSPNPQARLDGAAGLARVRQPMLDIYAGRDLQRVLASSKRRAAAAARRDGAPESAHTRYRDIARRYSDSKGGKVGYRQVVIPAATHDFANHEEALVRRIRGWLGRHLAE